MKKILVTLGLIISLISNAQVLSVPIGGTYPTHPIIGALEYRGATGSTFFVDTLHSFEFGYGNRKNLQLATVKSSILLSNNNFIINNNGINAQSSILMQPQIFIYSSLGNGTSVTDSTEIDFNNIGIGIAGNDSLYFKGISLENVGISNADNMLHYINRNKDAYTYLPKQISDSLYLAITSNITINGVTKNLKTNPTFTINGGGGGSGTVNTGTINQVPVYTGTNTVSGSNNFKFSPSSLHFNVGNRLPLWTGFAGLSPITSFIKDTAGTNFFTIENNDTSNNSRVGFAVVGARSIYAPNIARYAYFTLFSPSYTAVPFFKNKLVIVSGGNASGTFIYSDQGNIQLTTNSSGSTYNPDFVVQGANTQGGSATGFIGINTNNPQARLDVVGNFRCTGNIQGSTSNIPYTDINGVSNPNPNLLYQNGGARMFDFTTDGTNPLIGLHNSSSTQAGGFRFYNDGGGIVDLRFGGTASGLGFPYTPNDVTFVNYNGGFNFGTESASGDVNTIINNVIKFKVNSSGNAIAIGSLTAASLIKTGGTSSQILAADGSVITAGNNITISGGLINAVNMPTVKNSTSLLSLTTATTVTAYTTASGGMFEVAGFITVNAVATNVINFQVTFTDTHGLKTVTYPSMSTTGYNSATKSTFVAIAGSVITVSTVLTTSIGTINYDVGATIIKVQ